MPLIVGTMTDTRDCPITVSREGGDIYIHVDSPGDYYKNPSPHMTSTQAVALAALLGEAIDPVGGKLATGTVDRIKALKMDTTARGFKIFGEEILDLNGNKVRVQESSAAGDPCCYLFTTDERVSGDIKSKMPWSENDYKDPDPRLTIEMAHGLAVQLIAFAMDAESPENWHNTPEYIAAYRIQRSLERR